MSSDMSGPLSDKLNGTTPIDQMPNTSLPAGERSTKKPTFISEVRDARNFLVCLRASCLGGLTSQLMAEKLIVVP